MSITETKCDSPQEALERFEETVRLQEYNQSLLDRFGECDEDISELNQACEKAKEEVLIWMSYIP